MNPRSWNELVQSTVGYLPVHLNVSLVLIQGGSLSVGSGVHRPRLTTLPLNIKNGPYEVVLLYQGIVVRLYQGIVVHFCQFPEPFFQDELDQPFFQDELYQESPRFQEVMLVGAGLIVGSFV
uniref:Uncharacterized protein n=1 Tax=Cacopsylla melanoneura TaxID=428564 RepID=A0A8D9ASS4_9HEMI